MAEVNLSDVFEFEELAVGLFPQIKDDKLSIIIAPIRFKQNKYDFDNGTFYRATHVKQCIRLNDKVINKTSASFKNEIYTYFSNAIECGILETDMVMGFLKYIYHLFKKGYNHGEFISIKSCKNSEFFYAFSINDHIMYYGKAGKIKGAVSNLFNNYMEARRKKESLDRKKLNKAFSIQLKSLASKDINYDVKNILWDIVEDIITLSGNDKLKPEDIQFCNYYFKI